MNSIESMDSFSSLIDQLDHVMKRLYRNDSTCTELDLSNYAMGDDWGFRLCRALLQNTHLRKLNLSSNRLGPRSAHGISEVIRVHPRLQELDISNNWFRDVGASLLAASFTHSAEQPSQAQLRSLNLNNNHITSAGVLPLANALRNNNNNLLTSVQIEDNFIGGEGCRSLAMALTENTTLKRIHLKGNYGGHLAAPTFIKTIKNHNPFFMHLTLDCCVWCQHQIDCALMWNQFGRRAFQQLGPQNPSSTRLWPHLFARCSDKPHLLFQLIQGRSDLLLIANNNNNKVTTSGAKASSCGHDLVVEPDSAKGFSSPSDEVGAMVID